MWIQLGCSFEVDVKIIGTRPVKESDPLSQNGVYVKNLNKKNKKPWRIVELVNISNSGEALPEICERIGENAADTWHERDSTRNSKRRIVTVTV